MGHMGHKVVAEITQPVHDLAGNLVFGPGEQLAADDKRLEGLPAGHHRLRVAEVADKPAKPAAQPAPAPEPAPEPEPTPDPEALRGQARSLGVKVDGRWSAAKLQAEIDAATKEQK